MENKTERIQFRNLKIIQSKKGEINPTKTAGNRKRGICVHYWRHRWCIESSEMLCSLIIEQGLEERKNKCSTGITIA